MSLMIGTFERNIRGVFIYKTEQRYVFYVAQRMFYLGEMPRSYNIWQDSASLSIFILAKFGSWTQL